MARKIFVSYKHGDSSVNPINGKTTARDYVEKLKELFKPDEIYKGEGGEDLSKFKDKTIGTHLKDKIYDSSITLVLISPNMKDDSEKESDQWIPWEVSYSLKEITRNERTSHTNAVLAVVLPDKDSSYSYFLEEGTCPSCQTYRTDKLFQILRKNMFNIKGTKRKKCPRCSRTLFDSKLPSYIYSVKWCDFIDDKEKYLEIAEEIREKIDDYNITKTVD